MSEIIIELKGMPKFSGGGPRGRVVKDANL